MGDLKKFRNIRKKEKYPYREQLKVQILTGFFIHQTQVDNFKCVRVEQQFVSVYKHKTSKKQEKERFKVEIKFSVRQLAISDCMGGKVNDSPNKND